MFMLNVTM